jgi:hypothetical protein
LGVSDVPHRDDAVIGNVGGQLEDDQEPSVWITESFDGLFSLPLVVLDSRHVVFDANNRLGAFLGCQEPRIQRAVGEQEEADDRKCHSAAAENEEDRLIVLLVTGAARQTRGR